MRGYRYTSMLVMFSLTARRELTKEKEMNTIIPELTVIAIVFAVLTFTGVIIW